jgi:hypothetical protein
MSGMWDVMRSPFRVKHVDDGMFIENVMWCQ